MYTEKEIKLTTLEHIYPELSEGFREMVPWDGLKECLEEANYTDIVNVLRCKEFSVTEDDRINMEYAALILSATSTTSLSELILSYRANE